MKLKSIIAIALVAVLSLSIFVGCSNKGKEEGGSSSAAAKAASGQLSKVHDAVKAAYGDKYIPSMPFEAAQLEEQFGVKKDLVKEFIAEGPMMSAHVDTFVGIEANEGKAEEVEKALKAYQKKLIDDSMQYPMNMPKIKAGAVQRIDDYVFFMILGEIPMDAETEEQQLEAAKKEIKKATDAVTSVLKK